MDIIALATIAVASLLLVAAAISFLRAKDVFTMTHIVMIFNFYVVPLILLSIEIDRFSWVSLAKIITLIILNLIVANLLCHIIVRRAIVNKIEPDAKRVD
jgi:multisubunit Na+/H+ antiporter MnhG subunit